MALKLGTATYAYLYRCSLEKAIEDSARLGFKYLEIMTTAPHLVPEEIGSWERKMLRRRIRDCGIELVALNPTFLDINLISLNEEFRRLSVRQIISNLRLAADLGAQLVVVIVGRRHGLIPAPFDMAVEVAMDSIEQCLLEAEKNDVVFGLENGPANFIQTGQQVMDMVKRFDHPHLKVVFDVANAAVVEPVLEGLGRVKDQLIHFHMSDTQLSQWGHLPIGEGCVDFAGPTEFLKDIDYQGVGVLELTTTENLEEKLQSSLSFLEKLGWQR